MSPLDPHKEGLPEAQREIWRELLPAAALGFVLYGGTAIALRVSLDRGLAAARQMFGIAFQPSESLRAITYFEGGDLYLLTAEVKETLIRAASAVRELPGVEIKSRSLGANVPVLQQRRQGGRNISP